ncbi:DNA-binding response regulator [Psychroserpens algicola]|uniref:Response regulator n=1 Tax=Psychroserpens algicola TaxID=1719034 RepID=A0ABT0H992_9FLAO|nr:response regulator [Psychroserpens algicola]MCK8480926.1 response regulator [Psychroserpens algicola]
MFKKVLVAEDLGSTNYGIANNLKEKLDIPDVQQALYCDDAFIKVRKAKKDNLPFEILITDLSFTKDYREQNIKKGEELIVKTREVIPNIKVLVFSIENRPSKIKSLFKNYAINGYICKGRNSLKELEQAMRQIHSGVNYVSKNLERTLKSSTIFELKEFDTILLQRLSEGLSQEQISIQFKTEGISPCSLSSIEKRLNSIKLEFRAGNTIQLISIVKDLGLI